MGFRHFAGALIAWICVSGSAAAQTALKVILFPGAQNLPMWVAEKKGYFEDEELAVTTTPTPNSVFLVRSLLKGDHDVALAAFDNVVAYQEAAGEVPLPEPPGFFAFA